MVRRPPIAKMIQAVAIYGYLLAVGHSLARLMVVPPRLHHHRPRPAIAIMASKFKAINAVLVLPFNASKVLIAPCPRA